MPHRKEEVIAIWVFCCVAVATATSGDSSRPEVGSGTGSIRLRVSPRYGSLTPDEGVAIRCVAKGGGGSIIDIPYISFALMLDQDTVLPLSSGIPGVFVVPEPWSAGTLVRYNSVLLTIGPQMYPFLRRGENLFVCQAQNINGEITKQPFVINKEV